MKKLLFIAILFGLLFGGCGKDGIDGKAYIAFDWDWYVDYYWDNNPDVPTTINRNTNYNSNPGSFSFEYDCSDGAGSYWYYTGTYSISINNGTEASTFRDGDDGSDRYYKFLLNGNGYNLSYTDKSAEMKKNSNSALTKQTPNHANRNVTYIGEPVYEVFYTENAIIEVTKQLHVYTIE